MKFVTEFVGHFDEDVAEFFGVKSGGKYLTRAETVVFAAIGFDIGNRGRFNSPSVVDDQFSIDAKLLVELFGGGETKTREVAHGINTKIMQ